MKTVAMRTTSKIQEVFTNQHDTGDIKMFRKSLIALIATAISIPALAQDPAVFGGVANAYAFAYGVNELVAPLQIDTTAPPTTGAGVATFTVAFGTVALGDGTIITPLSTNAAITVGTGANAETVTPSAVSCNNPTVYQSCSFTATFANAHGTGDKIASASFGITEAGAYIVGKWGGGPVSVSAQLLKRAGITFTHAAIDTFITSNNSGGATAIALDNSGVSITAQGAFSFQAAAGSHYVSTTHVIY